MPSEEQLKQGDLNAIREDLEKDWETI